VGRAAAAKAAIQQRSNRPAQGQDRGPGDTDPESSVDHGAHLDDDDLDMSGESEQELLARTLGATVISETENT
jgi:DNA polymerase III subunit gamma/tau